MNRLNSKRSPWVGPLGLLGSLAAVLSASLLIGGCGSVPTPGGLEARYEERGEEAAIRSRLVRSALRLEGRSYKWGRQGPRHFDCSGLTWFVYEGLGLGIPRTAAQQAVAGVWVAPDELLPGDLVFFGPSRARIDHVGLVVSASGEPLSMVHSTTSKGVIRTEVWKSSYWSSRLRFGRRLVPGSFTSTSLELDFPRAIRETVAEGLGTELERARRAQAFRSLVQRKSFQ